MIDGVILPGALKRGEKAPKHAGETDPLAIQLQDIDVKSKLVHRLHKMEDAQKIKFTEAQLNMLVVEIISIISSIFSRSPVVGVVVEVANLRKASGCS